MNPISPDAQPWDNVFFITAALIIVLFNRNQMFRRGEGITAVLMPEDEKGD